MLEFGIWAILGLIIFVAAGIFSAEMDSAVMSFATFVIGLLLLEFGFKVAIWAAFVANPLLLIAAIVVYVCLGAAYTAIWRWPEYIRHNKDDVMEQYNFWAGRRKDNENTSFDTYLDSDNYKYNAWEHKERLGTWVGMWPFSLGWELARKPAIWIWNIMYNSLGKMFQSIGRNTARKLHDKL